MINLKPVASLFIVLFFVTILIPTILVLPFTDKAEGNSTLETDVIDKPVTQINDPFTIDVSVYRVGREKIEVVPIEDYIVGVVAAEMSAEFEIEALKAQALTARTYIVNLLVNNEKTGVPKGADVTDTVNHQVYKSDEELRLQWDKDYQWKISKIKEAVAVTSGQILTYDGSPIYAAFFSTSNGYTENAEDYWTNAEPYLRSVASPWDVNSPKFNGESTVTVAEFESKLGVKLIEGKIENYIERTASNRVAKVEISGKTLTGREIREKLGLKSSDFTWERKKDQIVIKTKGYGHGVGMSQYGANGMALEGKTYTEIVQHYYKDTEITPSSNYLNKITAKN